MKYIVAIVTGVLLAGAACPVLQKLDLQGNGVMTEVELPFEYLRRKPGVWYALVHQGGYKVYDLQKSDPKAVAIMGPLDPCIGIVCTDGKKMILFHKHYTNSLKSILEILKKEFAKPAELLIRMFTVYDAIDDKNDEFGRVHMCKTPEDELAHITKTLTTALKVSSKNVLVKIFPCCEIRNGVLSYRYSEDFLGRYACAGCYVAVELANLFEKQQDGVTIRLFSVDPYEANLYNMPLAQETRDMLSPRKRFEKLEVYTEARMDRQLDDFFIKHFHMNIDDYTEEYSFDTQPLYPVDDF
jgi:hypothetical protein